MLALLLLAATLTMAQSPQNRTTNTIVADVLAQMPAEKQSTYNQLMADLFSTGDAGVRQLIDQMNAPGKGSNASVEYAISGLVHYVSGLNNEQERLKLSKSFIRAFDDIEEEQTRIFVIRQLQMIGDDEAIEVLASQLSFEPFSEASAMALATIGSEKAGQVLKNALLRKMGTSKTQKNIIIALGEMRANGVESLLLDQIGMGDVDMQKATLYTLSEVGSVGSIVKMKAAAEKVNYSTEKTAATEAYIHLIQRLVDENGTNKAAVKAAEDLLKKATKANQPEIRIAALGVLMKADQDASKRFKLLQTALKDKDKEYRNSALKNFSSFADASSYIDIIKSTQKASADVRLDVLSWLGCEAEIAQKKTVLQKLEIKFDRTLVQELTNILQNDKSSAVKQATARTMVAIGNKEFVPVLAGLLKSADKEIVNLAELSLATFSADITPDVAKIIPTASEQGKVAAIGLLAKRRADAYINSAYELIKSGSTDVKAAAYTSLAELATEKDFVTLSGMLESADKDAVKPLQNAVIRSIARTDASKRTDLAIRRFMQTQEPKRMLFYPVLASTKDKQALDIITKGFNEGAKANKEAAFEALLLWEGFEVADILYTIATDPAQSAYSERALEAYVRIVSSPALSAENRLIYLRKAMDAAKTVGLKKRIMNNIRHTGTFTALIYSGNFLNDRDVQQEAAQSVMNIALNHPEYSGPVVTDLLNKVIDILDNPDADYQKQGIRKHLNEIPQTGYVSMFNGKDLTGWKGLVQNPIARSKMSASKLAAAQKKADEQMHKDWQVENGLLLFDGTGYDNLCSEKEYGDFEMYVDWMLDPAGPEADAGLYLRGTPQVQIWDTSRVDVGAQVGSGGLYNNQVHESKPLKVADNKLGEWNTFYIKMVGDRVTVYLNGELVTDQVVLENYWDRKQPIPAIEQIELQAHGSKVYYRDIYIKELPRIEPYTLSKEEEKEGFRLLFDGTNMHEWTGDLKAYGMEDGCISVTPGKAFGGNLYTKDEFADFVFRFEFQLTPGANNGVGIRTPMEGDAAYVGMEVQILDDRHPIYKNITPLQVHGSVYGIIGAERDALKPVGEWNTEEIYAKGNHIRVTVNGRVILDGDIKEATKNGTADGKEHPGLFNKKGHIGFLGHGSPLKFRNIRVKELK